MKRNSGIPIFDRIKAGNVFVLLLAACLSLALFSCSTSTSPPPTVDAKVNQHLTYQHLLGKDAPLKPYQTVLLNLSSLDDDHLSASPGSSYHNLPYEISNAGKFKYCIPDDDTHLTQVELFDSAGALVGNWKRGEPCTSVPLVPGKYTMHVHLDTTDSDPPIFMKPHDVEVTQTGTMKAARKSVASSDGQILMNHFLNLNADSLADVLTSNKTQELKQGWRVSTADPSNNAAFYQVTKASYMVDNFGVTIFQNDLSLYPVTQLSGLDFIYFNQEQGKVSILQGDQQVVSLANTCIGWEWKGMVDYNGDYTPYRVCDQSANIISLTPDSYPIEPGYPSSTVTLSSSFKLTSSGTNFRLYDSSNNTINWLFYRDTWQWVYGSGANPVNFNIKVRYGTTSGLAYPAMLANEVALFDNSWTTSGFPANTHYWIINADMKDFTDFSFDNPDQRIKTVIAGRGARAQLFQNPSFQGDSVYVSPPMDGEMLMTSRDSQLLDNGTIGSIRIEPNTNSISVYEYEYEVIVSANTCIGCDLRGFDASSSGVTYANSPKKYISNANFSDSDLSYSNFSINHGQGGFISDSNFSRVNFTGATLTNNSFFSCNFSKTDLYGTNLANAFFGSCNFSGTDFKKAILNNVWFYMNPNKNSEQAFYNACPKFEQTDLTSLYISSQHGFDKYFPVASGSVYNAATWWNNGQPICRPSLANAKVTANLFADKRLWQFVDAPGVDFSNMNLDGAVFAGSNLRKAIFKNASLKGAVFVHANLTGADVNGADLTGAHLEGAVLDGVNLYKAKTLSKAFLSGISLNAPNLSGLDMSGVQLKSGVYTNWDGHTFEPFPAASINGAYMYNTKLNGADLSDAFLNGVSWFGAEATGENATMIGTHFEHADLPGLNLKKAHLQGANFTDAQMVNANLSTLNSLDYSFKGTTFYQANLRGANLSGANLNQAALDSALIYAGSSQQYTYIEVLDDPATNPGHYRFYQQNYFATVPPASTNNITTCPNGTRSPELNCGDLASDYWGLPTNPPKPPTDCIERAPRPGETPSDDGKVLDCTSHRHPVNP